MISTFFTTKQYIVHLTLSTMTEVNVCTLTTGKITEESLISITMKPARALTGSRTTSSSNMRTNVQMDLTADSVTVGKNLNTIPITIGQRNVKAPNLSTKIINCRTGRSAAIKAKPVLIITIHNNKGKKVNSERIS